MSIEIRSFAEHDRVAVVQIWSDCGLVYPQNDPDKDIDRKLVDGVELFLVALVDGEVVGSAMGGYEGHRAWVNYLAVSPERQGTGIARAIMGELERRCREIGCPKINLQIRKTNSRVIEFYRRIGFVEDDVLCMGKRLIDDSRPMA